jgi:hypothetical protein
MRLILTTWLVLLVAESALADDAPLYQQEPYDTIKLDDANHNAELHVQPLELPDRLVPAKPNPDDELEIRLLDRPRKAFKLAWGSIVEVKLFEQRVLDEAERLVETKKLDEAFPYYEFLERRYPKMRGLNESYNKFLMAGAVDSYKRESYDECLALSRELYARDVNHRGAVNAILRAADKLIERRFNEQDYAAARAMLTETAEQLTDRAGQLTTTWNERFNAKAQELVGEAKKELQAKHYVRARRAVRLALAAGPDVVGGRETAAAIGKEYPEVVVGVTELSSDAHPSDSWASLRDSSLTTRSGGEGGAFRRESSDGKETRFTAATGASAAAAGQPREIVERLFSNSAAAVRALKQGDITVIDCVGPWEAAALADSHDLIVEPYRPTTLHLLIPNLRRPLMQTPMYRRAVAHAIDRSGILADRFSRGKLPAGCEVVDRPFPQIHGAESSDAVSAALRYDPGVAKLLAGYALAERAADARTERGLQAGSMEIVLAYPATEVARMAAQSIADEMRLAGLPIRLQEAAPNDGAITYEQADLIYVEWTPLEPFVELPRLIGRKGIGGDAGPIVERLMRDARAAGAANAAGPIARLQAAIGDATLVIPLWRLNNYVVYRRELTGVGKRPVTLYQHVEQWKLSAPGAQE